MSSTEVERLAQIAERLRGPDGCPWDREQTHASLRPLLLEETYEVIAALDEGDLEHLREELGDLLFHVVLHAQLAREEGAFDLEAVARSANEKLVRRHPHVFEGVAIAGDLLEQWERIKREERAAAGKPEASILDGLPKDLPSLYAAERALERAARVGIEPQRVDVPLDIDDADGLGAMLFDLAALAREKGLDAEGALRQANARFGARVRKVEDRARSEGRELGTYSRDELGAMWEATA
ncbi:MAG: MazG family protein [Chloroflexota bacterium]|nr:MazG family protein [Chloroflexota bacterium]